MPQTKEMSGTRDKPNDDFWKSEAGGVEWIKPFHEVSRVSFTSPVSIAWYLGGSLNACYNCVDRHLPSKRDQVAFHFEPDAPDGKRKAITYGQLHDEVVRFSLVLKKMGVKKGDRVTIYLPMIPEATYAMLACARLGAVHSVVFGGFSPDSLAHRIQDCESQWVITADEGFRGGKRVPLKANVDEALKSTPGVAHVLVVEHSGNPVNLVSGRDLLYSQLSAQVHGDCPPEEMDAEDPLFILYTSGSTNKPKGLVHTTGGYLVYAHSTFRRVFDFREGDVFWCTADVGWITGHSYLVYGPLSSGATSVLFEGVPNYPSPSRAWEVIDRHQVTTFYTAPTALRALMREGDEFVTRTSRRSLRLLGSVGEPINPEVWKWYHRVVGENRCPVVDTWWQTETGGILISPLPTQKEFKPGSAQRPLPGIEPQMLTADGKVISGEGEGLLVLAKSWPGQARTIYRDHGRFEDTYFKAFPGTYFTGDGCRRDADGDYWITGRVDDVLNVSGHRLGTAELESAILTVPEVSEAAVVGVDHAIKGQGIYAYVTLKVGVEGNDALRTKVVQAVVQKVGAIARPDFVQWAPGLPKTRSGKIMRRILRKVGEGVEKDFGDVSTLADVSVVEQLVSEAKKLRVASN